MSPDDVAAIDPGRAPLQQMLYRVDPSATEADLRSALGSITPTLGPDAVSDTRTYLEVKAGVDQLADLYVPILLAFSIFALLAAAFTIANVVSGIVLTNYGSIGVMKAIGYTPVQVTAILLAQILVPATVGVTGGRRLGTVASMPVIEQTAASFGLPAASAVSWPVIGAVLAIGLAVAAIAAIGPAIRAGRLGAVAAMTRGTAPSVRVGGGRLRRLGMRLPVAIQFRLGIAAGLAHPVRASMTLGALVVGVAALTFAIALNWSLVRVMADLSRTEASPVRAQLVDRSVPADHVTSAIASDPNTARSVSIGQVQASIPGVGAVPFIGYEGDSSWIGYALIRGRWFESAGEAVAPTNFFTQTGLGIGDTTTASFGGRQVTVRLVGEIFDLGEESETNLLVRGTWADLAALDPSVKPIAWEARPVDGVPADVYQSDLRESVGNGVQVYVQEDSSSDESFLLFLSVVALMGAVLIAHLARWRVQHRPARDAAADARAGRAEGGRPDPRPGRRVGGGLDRSGVSRRRPDRGSARTHRAARGARLHGRGRRPDGHPTVDLRRRHPGDARDPGAERFADRGSRGVPAGPTRGTSADRARPSGRVAGPIRRGRASRSGGHGRRRGATKPRGRGPRRWSSP